METSWKPVVVNEIERGNRPSPEPSSATRYSISFHNPLLHPQHVDFFDVGVADTDLQPHPAPPADFTSASSAQQPLASAGAGPPQHVCGPPLSADDLLAAPRSVVCVRVVSILSDSQLWPAKSIASVRTV